MDDLDAEIWGSISEDDGSVDDEHPVKKRAKRLYLPVSSQWFRESSKETGFHQSARECLQKIRDLLFQHQWQEAAEYMISYFQTLEDTTVTRQLLASEVIWRLGTEILHYHPNSNPEHFNLFYDQMKNIGVKTYLKVVCLEHAFHLLLTGHFDEAKQHLSIAESWRYGKQSASQADKVKLIHAYRGFLDYFSWISKKSASSRDDDDDQDDVIDNQEMHSYFRQASVSLQEILKQPGVWDPFVISYVNMLEFYNDEDGALSVLKEYAYDSHFPPNPNAHVYLYQFLKGHGAPQRKLIRVLEILQALVPGHELMLELCSLLLKSDEEKDLEEAASVIFSLLDYSSWKQSLEAWNCLRDTMKIIKKKRRRDLITKQWESRKDWWPAFHFRTHHARMDFEQSEELIIVKAKTASLLNGHKCTYCRRKLELFEHRDEYVERVNKTVKRNTVTTNTTTRNTVKKNKVKRKGLRRK
ncbi:TATA box-binding protein-associated factor RNA polymerase I subunit A [Arapaima gigas]